MPEAVWMRRVDDLPQKEVAIRLGITQKTVEKARHEGMKLLATLLFRNKLRKSGEGATRDAGASEQGMESHRQLEISRGVLAKRDSGDWTDERPGAVTRWIEASTANRVAFLRLEAVWRSASSQGIGAGLEPGTVPPPGEWQHSSFFDSRPPAVTLPPPRSIPRRRARGA